MQSMTAFASHEVDTPAGKLTCEIRSVNQRFLDLTIKCPDFLRAAENQFRKTFNQHLTRGKVTAFIKFFPDENTSLTQLSVNHALLAQLVAQADKIANNHQLTNNLSTSHYMTWPDVIVQQPTDTSALHQSAIDLSLIHI